LEVVAFLMEKIKTDGNMVEGTAFNTDIEIATKVTMMGTYTSLELQHYHNVQ